jgi:Protein of unknown function (DUF3915)
MREGEREREREREREKERERERDRERERKRKRDNVFSPLTSLSVILKSCWSMYTIPSAIGREWEPRVGSKGKLGTVHV